MNGLGRFSGRYGTLLTALLLPCTQAGAEAVLNPGIVIFARQQRAVDVELVENGKTEASYRVSLVNRRMAPTGELLAADEAGPGERFADAMLSFTPREFALEPGVAQVVHLSLRRPAKLVDGEYRSHLLVERVNADGTTARGAAPASIPLIVRQGTGETMAMLTRLRLDGELLSFQIERDGNCSVDGDLSATFTPDGADPQLVGRASGVAVFAPAPLRRTSLQLSTPEGLPLAQGKLKLSYREREEAGGQLLAEAVLHLP